MKTALTYRNLMYRLVEQESHQVFGLSGDGCPSYRVIQGVTMGRPSVIRSEVFIKNGEIS